MAKKQSYKLHSEDSRSFVLQHANGTKTTVLKHGLSSQTLQMIQGLQHFDEGGEVQDIDLAPETPTPQPQTSPTESVSPLEIIDPPSAPDATPAPMPSPQPTDQDDGTTPQANAPALNVPQIGNQFNGDHNAPSLADKQSTDAVPTSPDQSTGAMTPDLLSKLQANERLGEAGVMQQAAAKGRAGDEQAKAWDQNVKDQQAAKVQFDTEHKHIAQQNDDLFEAAKNAKIDPNRVWNNKSTGSKVSTIIGMMFSGAGSGVTGQPNMAAEMLNKQIDRDIEAQKADIQNKQSLYSLNLQRYRDTTAAEDATRMQLQAIVGGQVAGAVARNQSAEAQGAAKMMLSDMRNKMIPQMQQLAMTRLLANGNLSAVNPNLLPEEMRERFVPGVGLATTKEDASKVKEMQPKFQTFLNTLSQLQQFAQKNSGTLFDRSTVNEGKTLAAQAQDQYRQLNGEGVFRKGESSFIESMIPSDPTAYFAKTRVAPKLSEVAKVARQAANNFYKSRGVNVPGMNFKPDGQK